MFLELLHWLVCSSLCLTPLLLSVSFPTVLLYFASLVYISLLFCSIHMLFFFKLMSLFLYLSITFMFGLLWLFVLSLNKMWSNIVCRFYVLLPFLNFISNIICIVFLFHTFKLVLHVFMLLCCIFSYISLGLWVDICLWYAELLILKRTCTCYP